MRKAKAEADGEAYWFAEVKPDRWLAVDREPMTGEEDQIHEIYKGDVFQGTRTKPITFATRWFYIGMDTYKIYLTLEPTGKEL